MNFSISIALIALLSIQLKTFPSWDFLKSEEKNVDPKVITEG